MSFGQVSDFMDMLSSVYEEKDIPADNISTSCSTDDVRLTEKIIKSPKLKVPNLSDDPPLISKNDYGDRVIISEKNNYEDTVTPKNETTIVFLSMDQLIKRLFFENTINVEFIDLNMIKKTFYGSLGFCLCTKILFRISDWMINFVDITRQFLDNFQPSLHVITNKKTFYIEITDMEYNCFKKEVNLSVDKILSEITSNFSQLDTHEKEKFSWETLMILLIIISDSSKTESIINSHFQKLQNDKKYGLFDLSSFSDYYFWDTFSVCCKSQFVSDTDLWNKIDLVVSEIIDKNVFCISNLLKTASSLKIDNARKLSLNFETNERLTLFISSKMSLLEPSRIGHSKKLKDRLGKSDANINEIYKKKDTKTSFSDQLKKSNWLFETFKSLINCIGSNSNYLNDGRISKKGTYDESEKKYTKQIVHRKKPFTKGSRFDAYQNFLVHKWLYKTVLFSVPSSVINYIQSVTSHQFLDTIKSKFDYKKWNSKEYAESYKLFRSLLASIWFKIPLCIRRSILISEKQKKRFKHFDRFKFTTFLYISIFRQISQLITSSEDTEDSENIKITSIFSTHQMTQFIFTFLEEVSTGKTLVGDMTISEFFGNNMKKDDSSSTFHNNSHLSDSEYGEKQFKSIKSHIEDLVSRENTNKSFIFSNCSSMADLRQDGTSNSFALESTTIICPFSEKNKSKMIESKDSEYNFFVSSPKCITTDIENLGSNFKNEIHREYRKDNIDSIHGNINLQKLKECFKDQIFSCGTMEEVYSSCYSLCGGCGDYNKQEGVLFFSNPADKMLKVIFRGDTKDI